MLETVDPAKGTAAAPDEGAGSRAHAIVTGIPGAARCDDGPAATARARDGDQGAATAWSSDWLRLSHELRTPLNAILGNIELLLDGSAGPLAAPARACIGDIQAASRALLGQLQPLLLLVQARTSGPVTAGLPIDLLALLREAACAASASGGGGPSDGGAAPQGKHGPAAGGGPRWAGSSPEGAPARAGAASAAALPAGVCLMVPGDPVWLGALAAALVDLHAASAGAAAPLSIDLQPFGADAGVVARVFWRHLDPAAMSPLPLALIDAVLSLHGGRIGCLGADGLRLELPRASMVQSSMSD